MEKCNPASDFQPCGQLRNSFVRSRVFAHGDALSGLKRLAWILFCFRVAEYSRLILRRIFGELTLLFVRVMIRMSKGKSAGSGQRSICRSYFGLEF